MCYSLFRACFYIKKIGGGGDGGTRDQPVVMSFVRVQFCSNAWAALLALGLEEWRVDIIVVLFQLEC